MKAKGDEFVPVVELDIELPVGINEAAIHDAVASIAADDRQCRCTYDAVTHRLALAGIEELLLDRTFTELSLAIGPGLRASAPRIAFRETIIRPCEVEYSYNKGVLGSSACARVKLTLEPSGADSGQPCQISASGPDVLRASDIAEALAGVQAELQSGILHGLPVIGVAVRLIDGASHTIDGNSRAFMLAARFAVREGLRKGHPTLLEPVVRMMLVIPFDDLPAVQRDLAGRRGCVADRREGEGHYVLGVVMPAASMFGYVGALREIGHGCVIKAVHFDHYARVPGPDDSPSAPALSLRG